MVRQKAQGQKFLLTLHSRLCQCLCLSAKPPFKKPQMLWTFWHFNVKFRPNSEDKGLNEGAMQYCLTNRTWSDILVDCRQPWGHSSATFKPLVESEKPYIGFLAASLLTSKDSHLKSYLLVPDSKQIGGGRQESMQSFWDSTTIDTLANMVMP